MGRASRDKGKRGERELAAELRKYGYETRRTSQYCGANGDADVVGLPGIHIECKRTEKTSLAEWLEQARNDAQKNGRIPAIFHRKNNQDWMVIMNLEEWMRVYQASTLPKE